VTIALGAILMFSGLGTMLAGNFLFGTLGLNGVALTTFNAAIGAITGGIMGGVNAALAGGDLGDVLRGAAVGAVQGAISSGPLHEMEAGAQGLSMGTAKHVVGHGAVGGAANVAMGGKFQDGFVSAASSAFAGDMGWNEGATPVGRTIKAGIIGGTISALGGGKFANGAYTSAFQHLLNSELYKNLEEWKKGYRMLEDEELANFINWSQDRTHFFMVNWDNVSMTGGTEYQLRSRTLARGMAEAIAGSTAPYDRIRIFSDFSVGVIDHPKEAGVNPFKMVKIGKGILVSSKALHHVIKPAVLDAVRKVQNYEKIVGNNPDIEVIKIRLG